MSQLTNASSDAAPRRAIVIGSSIAGMTAARVLTNHFDQVIVIERDELTEESDYRKGVPQARQPHALLLRGLEMLEGLFAGLTDELRAAGAVEFNLGSQVRWFVLGGERAPYESQTKAFSCSRPLLESRIYRRVRANPKVQFVERSEVVNLETDAERTHVTGVRVRAIGDHRLNEETTIHADLIVDASGRDSRAPTWLKELGYQPPEETVLSASPGYASRIYERPADYPQDIHAIYIQSYAPDYPIGGIILPLEGNRWHVALQGMNGQHPPTDDEGFLEFARNLPHPMLYEAIKDAKPLTPVLGYRRGENRERAYNKLPRYLENFLAMGDSVYSFNPVYGQGMTVATMSSLVLDQTLGEYSRAASFDGLAQRFQTQLAEATVGAWMMATGEDRRWWAIREGIEIDAPTQMTLRYMDQVIKASLVMPGVADAFFNVMQMIEPPTVFFRPDIVLQVFATVPAAA